MSCDIVLVGVGGQGVLTIGELFLRAAFAADVPGSFLPMKGMAQRGGSVKAEVRLGREGVGPRIPERGADLVVGMERSETLRGLCFAKPAGTVLLFDEVWEPTGVMLGVDAYPTLDRVAKEIRKVADRLIILDPADVPRVDGRRVSANVYVLGAMLGLAPLYEMLPVEAIERVLADRWPKSAAFNVAGFRAGRAQSAAEATG